MENSMTSSRSTAIYYLGLNELIHMVYNFTLFSEIHCLLILFPRNLSSYTNYDQQKLMKYTFIKKMIYLFISTWSFQNLASPVACPVDLMAYCDQVITYYTNVVLMYSLLVIFKLLTPCASLFCCTRTLLTLLADYLILFYKTVASCVTQCVIKPPIKLMMSQTVDHIYNSYIE